MTKHIFKKSLAVALMLMIGVSLFADSKGRRSDPFAEEAEAVLAEYADRAPADLTFAELEALGAALSVPAQKSAYVRRSASASMIMPGIGQIENGAPLAGIGFMLADAAVLTGAAIGFYFLLPDALQIGNLDYFSEAIPTVKDTIRTTFQAMSVIDLLPMAGVAAGGAIVHRLIAALAAKHASGLAMDRIIAGEVEFEPKVGLIGSGFGHAGIGFGMSVRH